MDPVIEKFQRSDWTAGVVGLGYVGLPLAMAASAAGLRTIGYDISSDLVDALTTGSSHVEDVTDAELRRALASGARFTTTVEELSEADAIFIAVPSPLGHDRRPDMSFIESAARAVASAAHPGQVISLESTTYPGTTEDYFVRYLTDAGLRIDDDVFVAFSPERVDPGNVLQTADIPKVVGGVTPRSGEVAAAAYSRLVSKVHLVSSARAAELTKLLENTYRAVNIALVNELAQLANAFQIDIWEVIDAAATKPFGYQPFYPGPGVGGHCIPLDPQYLAWRARELRVATRFIDLAEDVNVHMPDYVVTRITDLLNENGRAVSGTRILGVGAAYKKNIGDDRESPSIDVLERLSRRGAAIGIHDPHVPRERLERSGYEVVTTLERLNRWTLAVILTDHDDVDYEQIAAQVDVVFDARGVYGRLAISPGNVVAM